MSGVLAACWLLGLFAAAPVLRGSARSDFVERLRDALILGIAIPFALGLIHALYPVLCWGALALCIALAIGKGFTAGMSRTTAPVPYVMLAALVAVTWPQLMRPLLDGDSLSYHLPNAASWVQAHSVWTTATRYWWYPPASELFAAGLYSVSGPFGLPWSGFGALMLLGFRVAAWAREIAVASPLLADSLAAATVTAYPLAIGGATLQNDVWLAAFFLEGMWTLRATGAAAPAIRTLAIAALIKPQGWILALIALIAGKARRTVWFAAGVPIALWIVRDAILWRNATVAGTATLPGDLFGSTIVAHGVSALALVLHVMAGITPFALLGLLAALFGPLFARGDRRLGWAAFASAVLFLLLPYGYATSVAQLATGASLRFAAPAIAAGAVLLCRPARRIPHVATLVLVASTLFGIWYLLSIFWNDGGTHVAIAFALVAVAIAAFAQAQRIGWLDALALGLSIVIATHLAARHPLDYYDDALRIRDVTPGVYRWIAKVHPPGIGGWGVRLGVVNVLSPSTRTVDLPDADPCVQARRDRILLLAVAQSDLPPAANAQRLDVARSCGRILYGDPIAVIAQP